MAPDMALFLKSKIARQIRSNGLRYCFIRYKVDNFNQLSDEVGKTFFVSGLFHTTNSYVKSDDSEGARIVSKQQPRMLVLVEDGRMLEKDDVVVINGNKYKVVEKSDINNFGIAFDVSLEMEV